MFDCAAKNAFDVRVKLAKAIADGVAKDLFGRL